MTESQDTKIAVLQVQVESILRDAEKREKIQDARHAETMLKLEQLSRAVSTGQSFNQGVSTTIKAAWAVAGGMVTAVGAWLLNKGA